MKIIIIGAGISGCTAYLQLKKHLPKAVKHDFTIYEAYSTHPDTTAQDRQGSTHSSTLVVGGGLGVGSNGLNVLKRLDEDLLRDIVRGGYTVDHSNLKNKNGRLLMRMDSTDSSQDDGKQGMNMVATSRHSLWKCLRRRIPDDVIINKRVSRVVANAAGRNIVSFSDGSADVQADLVIGADGIKSIAKRAVFADDGDDHYPPHYEGLVGIGGFIPSDEVRDYVEKGSMNFIFGGNGFFGYFFSESNPSDPNRDSPYDISEPGDSIAWWSTYAVDVCPNPKTIDKEDIVRQLQGRHGEWEDPVVQKIIHSVQVDSMYPTWTSPQLPTWEREGVVLVGDAAHALPSSSGQGSSQALEDVEAFALFLAYFLRREYECPLPPQIAAEKQAIKTAAKYYVDLRQPHVRGILEHAQKIQDHKREMNIVQEYFMYGVMWILGFFPSVLSKPMQEVFQYNVAEHVGQVLAGENEGLP
ncbi:hypothetical protein ASPWEDRAFT_53521 [Aspergillus wentii DTO 134E9]|uniref:FAD-binding domain-containing protein n=1 Tax=Aspergillus wentii DTO 134E9 TaxID=1073089 RepID=A0A1L9R9V0_ASPWE|nr:uncharacterized protein ASPWEDRAFT_186774 [Aspergillus wentii DTO 134E9]XP_040685373.1 uncharacterized protein ASPWEDRAFT_53521 [Aspergillus wentii DTO 134E9]OJJ30785.1 hypothetical protein ASPWEDRAFT_186774 [Aspergillus wentii DTO 134E9]OJJ31696.1 hypothetical protein ASPWEDRAFT_53521 [Aspergillus wentii DTO 134E9]